MALIGYDFRFRAIMGHFLPQLIFVHFPILEAFVNFCRSGGSDSVGQRCLAIAALLFIAIKQCQRMSQTASASMTLFPLFALQIVTGNMVHRRRCLDRHC